MQSIACTADPDLCTVEHVLRIDKPDCALHCGFWTTKLKHTIVDYCLHSAVVQLRSTEAMLYRAETMLCRVEL